MSTYYERIQMAERYYDKHVAHTKPTRADLELVALCFDVELKDLETALMLDAPATEMEC